MGFTIYYRSTRPVSPERQRAIQGAADTLSQGRTWLSCEPVGFFDNPRDGHLFGDSKPNFLPDPEDAASAARTHSPDGTQMPDGNVRNLIDILCKLSNDHDVDWEFSHDYDSGPIGFIRDGTADARLLQQIDAFADLPSILDDVRVEVDDPGGAIDDDDESEPRILPFRPRID